MLKSCILLPAFCLEVDNIESETVFVDNSIYPAIAAFSDGFSCVLLQERQHERLVIGDRHSGILLHPGFLVAAS